MKSFTLYLLNGIKNLFILQKKVKAASFEAIKEHLKLTDSELLLRQKALLRLSLLMVGFAVLLFFYAMYNFYFLHVSAGILSFVVMLIALVLAFRYHFWHFQIKERKLGCSIREWYKQGLLGEKP